MGGTARTQTRRGLHGLRRDGRHILAVAPQLQLGDWAPARRQSHLTKCVPMATKCAAPHDRDSQRGRTSCARGHSRPASARPVNRPGQARPRLLHGDAPRRRHRRPRSPCATTPCRGWPRRAPAAGPGSCAAAHDPGDGVPLLRADARARRGPRAEPRRGRAGHLTALLGLAAQLRGAHGQLRRGHDDPASSRRVDPPDVRHLRLAVAARGLRRSGLPRAW